MLRRSETILVQFQTFELLALLESLTTSYLVSQERQQLAERIDRVSRLAFPLAFVVLVFMRCVINPPAK